MIPILYGKSETAFTSNGVGILADAVSCYVTEKRNDTYECELTYPVDGALFSEIDVDCIIKAKPNDTSDAQPFRVYNVSKPINGVVTVSAEHISYQLSAIPVEPFTAVGVSTALSRLKSYSAVTNPFTVWTDKTDGGSFSLDKPMSFRAGLNNVLVPVFGGELEYDKYTVKLHATRGADNGVTIAYGKNITDIKQDENISEIVTGIYPYWQKGDVRVTLPEKVITKSNTLSYERIVPYDMTSSFNAQPSESDLRTAAQAYVDALDISPKVSISVSFIQLWQTAGYADIAALEHVSLCDTVTVKFAKLGIDKSAKVVKTIYDTLKERYVSVDIGDAVEDLADTIVSQQQQIANSVSAADVSSAVEEATEAITGASGGYIVLRPSLNPREILIMDTDDINTATQVWRFNLGGFGHSSTGINGPYGTAITQAGAIVANYITTGLLQSKNTKFQINLDGNTLIAKDANGNTLFELTPTGGKIGGFTINGSALYTAGNALYFGTTAISKNIGGTSRSVILGAGEKFGVSSDGTLYASGADIAGTINATSGKVGGWNIGSNVLTSAAGNAYGIALDAANSRITFGGGGQLGVWQSSGGNGISVDGYGLMVMGRLDCLGTVSAQIKNCVQETEHYGNRLFYCYETAENWLGDIGHAKTVNGKCVIGIDPIIQESIHTDTGYAVFLAKYGRGEIWVSAKHEDCFVVESEYDIEFTWEIKGKRIGFEDLRLEPKEEAHEPNNYHHR